MITTSIPVKNYSLTKSLDCLEKIGKLCPIVRTGPHSCRIFINDLDSELLLEISQADNQINITFLLGYQKSLENKVIHKIKHIFDLENPIYHHIDETHINHQMMTTLHGLRLIKDINLTNCVFRTIISQQVSLKVAANTVKKFIENFGDCLEFDNIKYYQFPTLEVVANQLTIEEIRALGLPSTRAHALMAFSQQMLRLNHAISHYSYQELSEILIQIKGIGQWTIETLGLFYFMDTNAVPLADVSLHRAIEYLYQLPHKSITKTNIENITSQWPGNKALYVYYIWEFWMLKKTKITDFDLTPKS